MTDRKRTYEQKGPILFFDLEYYVPEKDRKKQGYTLRYNPTLKDHFIIGGVFALYDPLEQDIDDVELTQYWIWDFDDEKQLLEAIYKYFKKAWDNQKKQRQELDLCGIGISKSDVPALYIRSALNQVNFPMNLYNIYFKTQHIELNSVAIPFYNGQKRMHPVCTNDICDFLKIKSDKIPSKEVWKKIDDNNDEGRKAIMERTKAEVEDCLKIFDEFSNKIYHEGETK